MNDGVGLSTHSTMVPEEKRQCTTVSMYSRNARYVRCEVVYNEANSHCDLLAMTTSNTQTLLNELKHLVSEGRNPETMNIDQLSTIDMLKAINQQDALVAGAVHNALPHIADAVDAITNAIQSGGRLIYMGAGTSGRLGILDAVECRPTFSVPDELVVGLIAGGEKAIQHAVEGAEDDTTMAVNDLKNINLSAKDALVGLTASGRTPYVIAGLEYAKSLGCFTASVACNPNTAVLTLADVGICVQVGPECITGSTRMKSGTAQKLVLNMLSSACMIKLGKVYQNLMVDVNATNHKLRARAVRIVMQATQCDDKTATQALSEADNQAKLAILMILTNLGVEEARSLLTANQGYLQRAQDATKA